MRKEVDDALEWTKGLFQRRLAQVEEETFTIGSLDARQRWLMFFWPWVAGQAPKEGVFKTSLEKQNAIETTAIEAAFEEKRVKLAPQIHMRAFPTGCGNPGCSICAGLLPPAEEVKD